MMKKLGFVFAVLLSYLVVEIESICSRGCDLALASYYVLPGGTISVIADYLDSSPADIVSYNPELPSADSVQDNTRINIPFSCDCIDGDFLGHVFSYRIQTDDTYVSIAGTRYANLTTPSWIESNNNYTPTNLPPGGDLNVTVNCSCGNSSVSSDYGLFITFPLRPGDSLSFVAQLTNVSASLLQRYNPGADFSAGNGLVFIPGRGENLLYLSFFIFIEGMVNAMLKLLQLGKLLVSFCQRSLCDFLAALRINNWIMKIVGTCDSAMIK